MLSVIQDSPHTPDTTAHEADMQGGHRTLHSNDPTQLGPGRRRVYHSPLMLSDPLGSPTSDTRSFDEDDMYGSDSDVETISLKCPCEAPATESDASLVCLESLLLLLTFHTGYGGTSAIEEVGNRHGQGHCDA